MSNACMSLFGSEIFDRLRRERPDFDQYAASKLLAVAGDATQPLLGLNEADAELVRSRAQITIHSAATVKFTEPLSSTIRKNCGGAMTMLAFVKSCRQVLVHMHVSTAYVNGNRPELDIREELYPLTFDLDEVMRMSPSEIDSQSSRIKAGYTNTYAISKTMAEHLMVRNHGDIPLVIYRPTVVGATLKEPVPGWIDQVAGFGAVIMGTGLGVLTMLPGAHDNVLDIVPLDLAVNHLLLSICAKLLNPKAPKLLIVHCGTSDPHQNNFPIGMSEGILPQYFAANPLKKAVAPVQLKYYASFQEYETQRKLRYELPVAAYSDLAKVSGSEAHAKKAQQLKKLAQRSGKFMDSFAPFTMQQWRFLAGNSSLLQPYTTADWWIDTYEIDWQRYLMSFCSGISRYITQDEKEDQVAVQQQQLQLQAHL